MKLVWRGAMVLGGLAVALGLGEVVLRLFHEEPPIREVYYLDEDGARVSGVEEAMARGFLVDVEPAPPRPLKAFAPDSHFYICYPEYPQPWFDPRGCVEVKFNSRGLREREEIGFEKPGGQKRILCIGDSFTFGWGIGVEDCWVRLVEERLRPELGDVVTVNCGGAGASLVEEYWWGLRDRFYRYEPDMVLVALCLNDLFISNASVAHMPEKPDTGSLLLDQTLFHLRGGDPLHLDPNVDWVDMLLNLPDDHPFYATGARPQWYWGAGGPQQALLEMQNWCRERRITFGVVLWPYVQGLGTAHYPFADMHRLVGEFCEEQGIEFLDLLPALRNEPARNLWVTPYDLHFSPLGHALAVDPIAGFVKTRLPNVPK